MSSITGLASSVYTMEYLSDGTLATGGSDRNVTIWNLTSGAKLVIFCQFPNTIYAIKEISPQVIAIGGIASNVSFYRVNSSMTPVLIKSIPFSSGFVSNSMVVATVPYGSINSTILYVGCYTGYANVFNVTDVNNISILAPVKIDIGGSILYSVEKSSKKLIIFLKCVFLKLSGVEYSRK